MKIPFTRYDLSLKKRSITVKQTDGSEVPLAEWIQTRNAIMGGSSTPILENIYTTIATEFAKADFKHVKIKDGRIYEVSSALNYLVSKRPNPYQSKFDFMFTMAYQLHRFGNAFAHIIRDEMGRCIRIDAINAQDYQMGETLYELSDGRIYIKLKETKTGNIRPVRYDNVIHLRLNPNNIFNGEANSGIGNSSMIVKLFDKSLNSLLDELDSSGNVYGVISIGGASGNGWNNSLASDENKISKQREIIERIKATKGNILVLDAGESFQSLAHPFSTASKEQIETYMQYLYEFNSINQKVVNGTATYKDMEVMFNRTIAPRLEQLILEMNYKVFSEQARAKGNEIMYYRNPFEYVPIDVAIDCAYKGAMDTTTNERRRMIYKLPDIEGGDVLMSNKNFETVSNGKGNENE